ncbi:MAG: carbohydrate ABC transporter permease [Clostridiales bacterium]|nr:carbohydrate ABC transporter permease [Clostridiales bacterium]
MVVSNAKSKSFLFHALIILFAIAMIYPLIWMICASSKIGPEIFQSKSLLPKQLTLENYRTGWKGISGYSFGSFFNNSFQLVIFSILGNLLSCAMAAYAFAKLNFKGRNLLFTLMMGTLMLPKHVRLIPQYIIFNKLGWVNTYLPMIIPKFLAMDGFFVFLMTQYMRGLPKELDEAATIDGCGYLNHYLRIIIPMSVPALISTMIFTFLWTWNDFFMQMIYISRLEQYTVALALRMFIDSTGSNAWGALFAMSTLSLIPLFLMFIIFQRYLVDGITAGGIKG